MTRHFVALGGVCVFVMGLVSASFSAELSALQPKVQISNGITYLSGGIGVDERAILDVLSKDYNLKLSFAERTGNYVSDVEVIIKSAGGNTVLAAVSQGPWFFAKLPAGTHIVMVTLLGKTQQQVARVTSAGQTSLYFYW